MKKRDIAEEGQRVEEKLAISCEDQKQRCQKQDDAVFKQHVALKSVDGFALVL